VLVAGIEDSHLAVLVDELTRIDGGGGVRSSGSTSAKVTIEGGMSQGLQVLAAHRPKVIDV
jgi:hypothetical protein